MSFGGGFGGGGFGAALPAPAPVGNERSGLDSDGLLNLSLEQLLDPDFVIGQTRSAAPTDTGGGPTMQKLKVTVSNETTKEFLTAGLVQGANDGGEGPRLTRELVALAAGKEDPFVDLADKRSILLKRLYGAYQQEIARQTASKLRRKTATDTNPLLSIGVTTMVNCVLALLEESGLRNPNLCRNMFTMFKAQLSALRPFAFADDAALPSPEISTAALDSVCNFLVKVTRAEGMGLAVDSAELLINLCVTRGSLSYFLNTLELLLYPPAELEGGFRALHVVGSITRFCNHTRPLQFTIPSESSMVTSWQVSELTATAHSSMATDGVYLYIHNERCGLVKIGTGNCGSAPGVVYQRMQQYRLEERSSLTCVGGRLYYRSSEIAPAAFIVLSCEYLTEIGKVHWDGSGSFESKDNSEHVPAPADETVPCRPAIVDTTASSDPNSTLAQRSMSSFTFSTGGGFGSNPLLQGSWSGGVACPLMYVSHEEVVQLVSPVFSDGTMLYTASRYSEVGFENLPPEAAHYDATHVKVSVLDPAEELSFVRDVQLGMRVPKSTAVLGFGNLPEHTSSAAAQTPGKPTFTSFMHGGWMSVPRHHQLSRLSGAITMECWIKLAPSNDRGASTTVPLFYQGDNVKHNLLMVAASHPGSQYVSCGAQNSSGYAGVSGHAVGDLSTWTHIAGGHNGSSWWVSVNGNLLPTSGGSNTAGAVESDSSWIIGGAVLNQQSIGFHGYMAHARLWNCHRTIAEINASMRATVPEDTPHLLGNWPLDEPDLLSCRDLGPLGCHGLITNGMRHSTVQPPFKSSPNETEGKDTSEDSSSCVPIRLPLKAMDQAVFYSNGECVGVFYSHQAAASCFNNFPGPLIQVFDLSDGGLILETICPSKMGHAAAYFTKGGITGLWTYDTAQLVATRFDMKPPSRRFIKRSAKGVSGPSFPETEELLTQYPLPQCTQEQLVSETESLGAAAVMIRLLNALEGELDNFSALSALDGVPPSSLRRSFMVELTPGTFALLYSLLAQLTEEYFDAKAEDEEDPVRLFALLIGLRVLKTNITHMVGWNVHHSECGFEAEGDGSSDQLRHQYVMLLEKLSTAAPKGPLSSLLAPRVQREVCETLTVAMSLFYMRPKERVSVLGSLVSEVMTEGAKVDPLRLLLLDRYFDGQSSPSNILALVPAIASGYTSYDREESTENHKGIKLMKDVLILVLQETEALLVTAKTAACDVVIEGPPEKVASLLPFLVNCQSALFSLASESKANEAAHQMHVDFLIGHVLHLSDACAELLSFVMKKVITEDREDAQKENSYKRYVSRVLQETIGSLLLPLFAAVWGLELSATDACKLLPSLTRLLGALDELSRGMPETIVAEKEFVAGGQLALASEQSATAETKHPVARGVHEFTMAIPGSTEMVLTFDPNTFQTQGVTVSLYKEANKKGLLHSFTSMPTEPVKVAGDVVQVEFNTGYSNSCWGCAVHGSATVEDTHQVLPWLLDLEKSVAIVAARCSEVLIRGDDSEEVDRNIVPWADSELLQQGARMNAKAVAEETQSLSWLPEDSKIEVADSPEEQQKWELLEAILENTGDGKAILDALHSCVKVQRFPVPEGVQADVDRAIHALIAVIIHHNSATSDAVEFLEEVKAGEELVPTDALSKAYSRPFKLQHWLRTEATLRLNARTQKKDKEDEEEGASTSKGKEPQEEEDIEEETEEELMAAKQKVYADLCGSIVERCRFLLGIESAVKALEFTPPDLVRQKSRDTVEGITEAEKKARSTLLAWKSAQSEETLASASPDERFQLIWKMTLKFFSFDTTDVLPKLREVLMSRRKRARSRIAGLGVLQSLLERTELGSVKREVAGVVIPALSARTRDPMLGIAPKLMTNLLACGPQLCNLVRAAMEKVHQDALSILKKGADAGSDLLVTILPMFNIDLQAQDAHRILASGILPALHTLLSTTSQLGSDGNAEDDGEAGPSSSTDFKKKMSASDELEGSPTAEFVPAAWSLLDLLIGAIVRLSKESGSFTADKEVVEPLFAILSTQLAALAESVELKASKLQPTYTLHLVHASEEPASEPNTLFGGGFGVPTPMPANTGFGGGGFGFGGGGFGAPPMGGFGAAMPPLPSMTTTVPAVPTKIAPGSSAPEGTRSNVGARMVEVKVLNLFFNLCKWDVARPRLRQPSVMTAFFTVLRCGSPRLRLVVLRILRLLLPEAELTAVDACVTRSLPHDAVAMSKPAACAGDITVRVIILQIGQALSAPAYAAVNLDNGTHTHVEGVPVPNLHSHEHVHSWMECVQLLRFLADSSERWAAVIDEAVKNGIESLPALTTALEECAPDEPLDDGLMAGLWFALGCLSVHGGLREGYRVGARVRVSSSGMKGTVVERRTGMPALNQFTRTKPERLTVLQEDEGDTTMHSPSALVPLDEPSCMLGSLKAFSVIAPLWTVLAGAANGLPEPVSEAQKKERKKDAAKSPSRSDPTSVSLAIAELRARGLRSLFGALHTEEAVAMFVENNGVDLLYKIAAQPLPSTIVGIKTNELEDRAAALYSAIARRVVADHSVRVQLTAIESGGDAEDGDDAQEEKPAYKVEVPSASFGFDAFDTDLSKSAPPEDGLNGEIVYLRLGDMPNADNCVDKIVLIDAMGSFEERVEGAMNAGAKAIFLAQDSAKSDGGPPPENVFINQAAAPPAAAGGFGFGGAEAQGSVGGFGAGPSFAASTGGQFGTAPAAPLTAPAAGGVAFGFAHTNSGGGTFGAANSGGGGFGAAADSAGTGGFSFSQPSGADGGGLSFGAGPEAGVPGMFDGARKGKGSGKEAAEGPGENSEEEQDEDARAKAAIEKKKVQFASSEQGATPEGFGADSQPILKKGDDEDDEPSPSGGFGAASSGFGAASSGFGASRLGGNAPSVGFGGPATSGFGAAPSGGFGGGGFGGGGFGGAQSGGFGAPAASGFGAPAAGGFGAPAAGGFGAPAAGGFGAPAEGGFGSAQSGAVSGDAGAPSSDNEEDADPAAGRKTCSMGAECPHLLVAAHAAALYHPPPKREKSSASQETEEMDKGTTPLDKGKGEALTCFVARIETKVAGTLRAFLGVPDDDMPDTVYLRMQVEKLKKMGYTVELAMRALRKVDQNDVELAAKWLEDNASWLQEQEDMLEAIEADVVAEEEVDDDEVKPLNLDVAWSRFAQQDAGIISTESSANKDTGAEGLTASPSWASTLATCSSTKLLWQMEDVQAALLIHYARRSLVCVLARWPRSKPLSVFGTDERLTASLHIGLSLDDLRTQDGSGNTTVTAATLRGCVVDFLDREADTKEAYLTKVLHDDCSRLLRRSSADTAAQNEWTFESAHMYRHGMKDTGTVKGTPGCSLFLRFDPRCALHWAHSLQFFSDEGRSQLVHMWTSSNDSFTHMGDTLYYTFDATSDQHYTPSFFGYRFTAIAVGGEGDGQGGHSFLEGNTDVALTTLELLMSAAKPRVSAHLLVVLIRCLPSISAITIAQRSCRVASRLLRRWLDVFTDQEAVVPQRKEAEPQTYTDVLRSLIDEVEGAYSTLRTGALVQWARIGVPLPHVQSLLELLLAGRTAFPSQKIDEQLEDVDPSVVEAYKRGRDGSSLVSFIDPVANMRVDGMQVGVGRKDAGQRQHLIGDVCVSNGKWYFEVKLKICHQNLQIGWVTRKFQPSNAQPGFGMSGPIAQAWMLSGPTDVRWSVPNASELVHAGVEVQQLFPNNTWSVQQKTTVLGLCVDLDAKEMSYMHDGEPLGVMVRGFDPEDGLYPIIINHGNCDLEVNFGREEFEHPPPEGFNALENPAITVSSWLTRYEHAANVTQLVYTRKLASNEKVVDSALSSELEPTPHELPFEVHLCDGSALSDARAAENLLADDDQFFETAQTQNVHVVFKLANNATHDFVLREVKVSSPSRNQQSAVGGLFNQNTRIMVQNTGVSAGLVFVANESSDIDSYSWCDGFTKEQYEKFSERKSRLKQPWRSHEPVAFFEIGANETSTSVSLKEPHRGRYVVVKFLRSHQSSSMTCQRVELKCIHGTHPLANLIGMPGWEEKANEVRAALKTYAVDDAGWTIQRDEAVVALAQAIAMRSGTRAIDLDAVMLTPTADDLIRFSTTLGGIDPARLRSRFSLLKYLNRTVTPLLQYVDVSMYANFGSRDTHSTDVNDPLGSAIDEHSLSHTVFMIKGLFFIETKKSVLDAMLEGPEAQPTGMSGFGTGFGGGFGSGNAQPRIILNRISASNARENPERDPNGLKSVFGQMFAQLRAIQPSQFRRPKNEQCFMVDFLGEGSIDVGGPYREAVTMACADLMSDYVPLFITCPNGVSDVGLNREKRVIAPSSKTALQLAMFQFIGMLMGMALRTKMVLPLDLPSIVWKLLVGEPLDRVDLEDVDKLTIQAMDQLTAIDKEQFEVVVDEVFTTHNSSGVEVELIPGGSDIPVTFERREEFAQLVIKAKLTESEGQVASIRKGLHSVVPASMLSLFSHRDLELMVCGNPDIDIDALRKHTNYRNGFSATDPTIRIFWKAMRSFSSDEKQMFLRFVWGRNRLPLSDADWNQQFTISRLKSSPDSLPVAHTCFFSLDLPVYPDYTTLRSKILFAIMNCQAIDTDFNPSTSGLNAWIDD